MPRPAYVAVPPAPSGVAPAAKPAADKDNQSVRAIKTWGSWAATELDHFHLEFSLLAGLHIVSWILNLAPCYLQLETPIPWLWGHSSHRAPCGASVSQRLPRARWVAAAECAQSHCTRRAHVRGRFVGSLAATEQRNSCNKRDNKREGESTYILQPLVVQRFVVALQQVILVVCLLQRLRLCSRWYVIDIMALQGAATGGHACCATSTALKLWVQAGACLRKEIENILLLKVDHMNKEGNKLVDRVFCPRIDRLFMQQTMRQGNPCLADINEYICVSLGII